MNSLSLIWNTLFAHPLLNILVAFYSLFLFFKLPGALGFAIIGLTVCVRLLLQPFFHKQMDTAKKMGELKPQLDLLSKKHKGDSKTLQQAQLKLYQEAGVNPASGCLFLIIQIPVFIALYNTLNQFLTHGASAKVIAEINKALYFSFLKISSIDPMFLGFNLALSPQKAGQWHYYLIPVITAVLQYFQAKVSTPHQKDITPSSAKAMEGKPAKGGKGEEKAPSAGDDFQKAMSTQMKYIFPLLLGWFSYTLPVGLSLYWNIFSIFSIIQYQKVHSTIDTSKSK